MKIIKNKVFLGGTCPQDKIDFDYRKLLIPYLENKNIDYFNPVVEDWTPEDRENEERQKDICNIHLYFISPNMRGVYSIAEMFGSLIKYKNKKVVFAVTSTIGKYTFSEGQGKSLKATAKLFKECGGTSVFDVTFPEDYASLANLLGN